MEERYLYSVNPRRPIKNLPGITAPIRTPKSLRLSKDEVRECLKNAVVFRRFANEGVNERVTISNVDRLHNDAFMKEDEYQKFLDAQIDSHTGSVINPEPKFVEKSDMPVEEKVEEVKEEAPVEEEKVEESTEAPIIEEVKEEAPVEEEKVEESTETPEQKPIQKQNNYSGKRHK